MRMNNHSADAPESTDMYVIKHVVISATELNELPLSTYECDLCGMQVKTKANLRAHHVKTHRILKNDSDVAFYSKKKNTVRYTYHCPVVQCRHSIDNDGGFASCSRLKQHFQNVHMSKSYACDRCGRRFPTPSAHDYHKKLCGNVYSCSFCAKTYNIKKHLMQHFRRTGHRKVNNERSRPKLAATAGFSQDATFVDILPPTPRSASSVIYSEATPIHSQPTTWIPVVILPIPVPSNSWTDLSSGANTTSSSKVSQSQVMLSEAKLNASDIKFSKTKPRPPLLQMTQRVYMDSHLSERSTQTARAGAVVDASVATQSCPTSVSVNIGTDEDDISVFLGSLFCDASVETTFPSVQLVHEYTDTSLDADAILGRISPMNQHTDATFDTNDLLCGPAKQGCDGPPLPCILTSEDEKFTDHVIALRNEGTEVNQLLTPFSKEETSNRNCNMNPALSMAHSIGSRKVMQLFLPPRPLETPPPTRSQSSLQLLSVYDDPECSMMHHQLSLSPENPCLTPSISHDSEFRGMTEIGCQYPSASVFRPDFSNCTTPELMPSFQSIGLQSNLWSPNAPVYASMETQTMDADLESWLNSVHTQTAASPFDIHAFTDMGVGVSEDFLSAALDSVEANIQYPD